MRVNPIACDAHGLCAELFPERISLDDWGYPMIDGQPIEGELSNTPGAPPTPARAPALLLEVSRRD